MSGALNGAALEDFRARLAVRIARQVARLALIRQRHGRKGAN